MKITGYRTPLLRPSHEANQRAAGATRESGTKRGDWRFDRKRCEASDHKGGEKPRERLRRKAGRTGGKRRQERKRNGMVTWSIAAAQRSLFARPTRYRKANAEQRRHRVPKQRGQARKEIERCGDDGEHRRRKTYKKENFNRNKSG